MSPFNRAAWEGTKPLVEPMPAPLEVGALVYEKAADDSEEANAERRGGMIVARTVDHDTGAVEAVTVIDSTRRHGRFEVRSFELAADSIDRSTVTVPDPFKLYRAAAGCCLHVGERHALRGAGRVVGFERWLLEVGRELLVVADELYLARAEARREHKEGENVA